MLFLVLYHREIAILDDKYLQSLSYFRKIVKIDFSEETEKLNGFQTTKRNVVKKKIKMNFLTGDFFLKFITPTPD